MGLTPTTTLLKSDWKQDHIYLVQFPRCGSIISTSPFAIKLETWLRFTGLPYTVIDRDCLESSLQTPFRIFPMTSQAARLKDRFHSLNWMDVSLPTVRLLLTCSRRSITLRLTKLSLHVKKQKSVLWKYSLRSPLKGLLFYPYSEDICALQNRSVWSKSWQYMVCNGRGIHQ